jgi:dihydroxyacetone kinase-like predicted kinase
MQGYSAVSVITPGITDIQALLTSAQRAAGSVTDAEITRAVRDASMDGQTICTGDYIAISEGKIVAVAQNPEQAALKMLETVDIDLCEIITLFVGKDVTADKRVALTEQLKEIYDECEIQVYEGGQEVYDYLLAVE